ncbi:hypothetical protein EIQ03_07160 [Xanthomonas campestris pv. raphani]|uniref:hypothetical protein n=1 Tax=Xanthomonas campestris TaxID=339 RepID=UPI002B23009D|nr:hypothetical protein [Xanthomonas campestris]MEA9712204.1 hypothetical protein [Xanthomonas campestris]
MLTFKTQFPITAPTGMSEFMDCCRTWIVKSPHTKLTSKIPDGIREGRFGDEDEAANFGFFESETISTGGVRFEKTDDDGVRWVTDVIGHKTEKSFWVSVQLNVDSELPVERLEQGKRPYIVKLLMQNFAGGHDGELPVTDDPIFLSSTDTDLAEKIICAGTGSAMPTVYVSRDHTGAFILEPSLLAKWLSGMAHVVVEPSRKFSSQIMRQVYGENVYGGAVAIYWPDGVGKWIYLPSKWSSPAALQTAIAKKIRLSLLYQRLRRECTWSYLQEVTSRQKLEVLRASGSDNIDEYIGHFDKEISAKDEEIQRLEAELVRARYSKREIHASAGGEEHSISLETSESDLYQGEQVGLIIESLKSAAVSAEQHSRRRNLLDALVLSNDNPGDREEILERLKELLRQYTSMTAPVRTEFTNLGFTIYEEGKHYKLLFQDDTRYPFILPKTGSDWRGGLNAFSDIKRRLF